MVRSGAFIFSGDLAFKVTTLSGVLERGLFCSLEISMTGGGVRFLGEEPRLGDLSRDLSLDLSRGLSKPL